MSPNVIIQRTAQTTTHLLKTFVNPGYIRHPTMPYSSQSTAPDTTMNAAGVRGNQGEAYEPRQKSDSPDAKPNPANSIPLNEPRQRLIDDVIALYSCQPTIERVMRYTKDCVYDDQFSYANDRYQMAGQWFALPKLFKRSENLGYEIVRNEPELIQFKNEQAWTFPLIPKTAVVNALVSLSLDPATANTDFPQIKYHKDQADQRDYEHKGIGHMIKKWQAERAARWQKDPNVEHFKADKGNHLKSDVNVYKDKMSDDVIGYAQP